MSPSTPSTAPGSIRREDVTFASDGASVAAWLYRPKRLTGSPRRDLPVIVMAHGLGGVREMRLDAFAERFVAAGYVCLVFDYRGFGASEGGPRQLITVRRQLDDWRAAVAFARDLDGVDPERVVLWGSSFSGGHVISLGAEDGRVAAVVSQCPFTDGLASTLAVPPRTSLRLTWRALKDLAGSWLGWRPTLVPLVAEPGGVALMSAPDAAPGYLDLMPERTTFRNAVAARIGLFIAFSFPGLAAKRLRCPALFVLCDRDSVAPAHISQRHVSKAPLGEVIHHDVGHFDIYVGEPFETVVREETSFLRRHVPVA